MSASERSVGSMTGIGAVVGAVAYGVGYLLVYVTQRGSVDDRLREYNFVIDLLGGDPIPAWQAAGWLFYNAHAVDVVFPGFGGTRRENLIANADEGAVVLLYLVPPALLLVAGFATAALSRVDSPSSGGVAGALVALGYLPLAVAGTFVFAYAIGDGSIAPETITAGFVAGVVYPVAFGGIGGVIAGELTGGR